VLHRFFIFQCINPLEPNSGDFGGVLKAILYDDGEEEVG
jgi:hypothetical protein